MSVQIRQVGNTIEVWQDGEYSLSLSEDERRQLTNDLNRLLFVDGFTVVPKPPPKQ